MNVWGNGDWVEDLMLFYDIRRAEWKEGELKLFLKIIVKDNQECTWLI